MATPSSPPRADVSPPFWLEKVRAQHPFKDLRYRYPCLRFEYPEAMALLRKEGPALLEKMAAAAEDPREKAHLKERIASVSAHGDLVDISTEDEKLLGEIIANIHGQDFYVIDKFPADVRPFYTMPDPTNEQLSNSYDIFIRGEEVTSGAQRIHDPAMLLEQVCISPHISPWISPDPATWICHISLLALSHHSAHTTRATRPPLAGRQEGPPS